MFTGIIEEVGTVSKIKDNFIVIESGFKDVNKGDSISVNGICLTVCGIKKSCRKDKYLFEFSVSEETINKTNFRTLKVNEKVNLERALISSDRINGHFVTGHIDTTGKIVSIKNMKFSKIFNISCDKKYSIYIVSKCSIALDGISLTVIGKNISSRELLFTVSIIPYTYKNTNLYFKNTGDIVNIEIDILAKYIVENYRKNLEITEEFLKKNGYL